jgi:hypothetical protein
MRLLRYIYFLQIFSMFNKSPRYKDIRENGGRAPCILNFGTRWSASLSRVKKSFGTHWIEVWMGFREEEILFFLPGIEPQFLNPVRNLVIMTEVPLPQCNMRTFHNTWRFYVILIMSTPKCWNVFLRRLEIWKLYVLVTHPVERALWYMQHV